MVTATAPGAKRTLTRVAQRMMVRRDEFHLTSGNTPGEYNGDAGFCRSGEASSGQRPELAADMSTPITNGFNAQGGAHRRSRRRSAGRAQHRRGSAAASAGAPLNINAGFT